MENSSLAFCSLAKVVLRLRRRLKWTVNKSVRGQKQVDTKVELQ